MPTSWLAAERSLVPVASARCVDEEPLMQPLRLSTEAACTEACEAQARCGAVTHDVEGTAECRLYGACLMLAHVD